MQVDIDIESVITAAVAPERLAPMLDKAINEAIKSAINNATGYNSEFQKGLEAQFKEALPHGLGLDDMMKFQHVLNTSIKNVMQGASAASIECALKEIAQDALPEVPEVIDLSEFMAKARDGFHKDNGEAYFAYWEESSYGGGWLYLDDDEKPGAMSFENKSREAMKHRADIRLAVNAKGEVYAMRFDGVDVTPSSRPNIISKFDALLMAMYVGRTRLNVDIGDDEVEQASSAQYE